MHLVFAAKFGGEIFIFPGALTLSCGLPYPESAPVLGAQIYALDLRIRFTQRIPPTL